MTVNGKHTPSGRLAGKLMLSGALILGSGAYAWWQQTTPQAPPPMTARNTPAQKLAALPRLAPQSAPQAVTPVPAPTPTKRTQDETSTSGPQTLAPDTPSAVPLPAPGAPVDVRPAIAASTLAPGAAPPAPKSRFADGDYTGQPADAVWGLIQVKVSIRGGAVATVECLEYPDHRRRSIEINGWALPVLGQEAIAAQSAELDIVTQATTTSVGYRQSLATALAQARS